MIIHAGESAIKECSNIESINCKFEGNYPFWHVHGFIIDRCFFDIGGRSALWYSDHLKMTNTRIDGLESDSKYIFQYVKNLELHNAKITTKDALWETENVTIYDSELNGEYLGWHSRNLRLINCKISGTQPLCYAENLILENCIMADDCDLAFEYRSVNATIKSPIHSVKNPRTGSITADSYGKISLDKNIKSPADCKLKLWDERTCFSD